MTTFRAGEHKKSIKHRVLGTHGMLLRDNIYGRIEEDVWRRDFTVNALYYNSSDQTIIDYCGGMEDLAQRRLKIIGDPTVRFTEDPVRLLRAIRFCIKLNFTLDPETEAPMKELSKLLQHVSPARLFDEFLKLIHSGQIRESYHLLKRYQLFTQLFPKTATCPYPKKNKWFHLICTNTDQRFKQKKTVSPTFLLAALLWPALATLMQQKKMSYQDAARRVIQQQQNCTTIPKRYTLGIYEIWNLQPRLAKIAPHDVQHLIHHPRFRAGYDFLLLRAQVGEVSSEIAQWWKYLLTLDSDQQQALIDQLPTLGKYESSLT